jgi:O-antigen/teichoic acid export membrane protein
MSEEGALPITTAEPPPPADVAPPAPEPPEPAPPIERRPERREEPKAGGGKWFSMGAAIVVIICFFLPWVTVSCSSFGLLGQDYEETWSGYELASGGINLVSTVNVGDTQGLYVVLAAAVLVFLILLFSGRRRVKGGTKALVTLLTLGGGGALASVYAAIHEEVQEFVSAASEFGHAGYRLELGLWGTIIGLAGMALGAIADGVSGD